MVDEASLASTKQVRDFLAKIGFRRPGVAHRRHPAASGCGGRETIRAVGQRRHENRTSGPDRTPEEMCQNCSKPSSTFRAVKLQRVLLCLEQQGRVTEIFDAQQRIAAIAKSYAANPENTIVVSPDNTSRRQINQAVRAELQARGTVATADHSIRVLSPRSDMTGADRTWAAQYSVGDVLYYPRGSQDIGIEKQSYAEVISTQPQDNMLYVQKADGTTISYNPSRLYGVNVYRELEREFAVGDRLSFTAPSKELGVANRDLGTVQQIDKDRRLTVRMDSGRCVSFDSNAIRHFDHGYAVTSHSSQGLTAERVMVNLDSHIHPDLVNQRFAYVAVSRGSHDAHIYTDNATSLISKLSHDVVKSSALQVGQQFISDPSVGIQI